MWPGDRDGMGWGYKPRTARSCQNLGKGRNRFSLAASRVSSALPTPGFQLKSRFLPSGLLNYNRINFSCCFKSPSVREFASAMTKKKLTQHLNHFFSMVKTPILQLQPESYDSENLYDPPSQGWTCDGGPAKIAHSHNLIGQWVNVWPELGQSESFPKILFVNSERKKLSLSPQ